MDQWAARWGAGMDKSVGLGQQTIYYAKGYGVGDGTNTPTNFDHCLRVLATDPERAIKIAASQFGHYYHETGSVWESCAKYNGGPRATWDSIPAGNRANYERAMAQATRYLEAPMPSRYVFPVPGGQFSDTHWDSNGDGKPDLAVDIFAPEGTPILACTSGRTEYVRYPAGGETVTLYGDDGMVYYHAHCQEGSVVMDGRVAPGAQIGRVGRTGNARTTPPHCHWAVGTRAYGIDRAGAGDLRPWERLRQWQAGAPDEEDPAVIDDLRKQLAEAQNLLGVIQHDWVDAAESAVQNGKAARLKKERNEHLDAALAALATIRRGGPPED
jgi:murein DD-endopeptidase MepM/ murein hydrolase activator NlpD